jgi:hypothetical protein
VVFVDDPKHRRSFRDDWDPRAIIALIVVIGAFILAVIGMLTDTPEHTVPAWTVALLGAITVFYFKDGKGER